MNTPPELVLFIGRFHPLLVHLPVALLLLLAALEGLARSPRFKHANANAGIILAILVPAAVLSALCGWLLSFDGGYQAQLLSWHKWTGFATAVLCAVAALLHRLELRKPYRWSLFAGVAVLLVASHFGGSLTHGSDYLVRYAPRPIRQWFAGPTAPAQTAGSGQADELPVFAAAVKPVLDQYCVSCHGPEKSKGGLRLDSVEAMAKGGDNGAALVPGKPEETLLLKRMRLPLSDEDHMPPEGKAQPSAADLTLLEWWVSAGAPATLNTQIPASGSALPPAVARLLRERAGLALPGPKQAPPRAREEVQPLAAELAAELNVVLEGIAAGEPWLQCNASLAGTNFGDASLARLSAVGSNLRWLDLGGTGVSDAGLAALAEMPNLTRLHLEKTAVTDSGLRHVSGLANLEYLNLHHTAITDEGVGGLRQLANLRQLYLWGTKVSPAAAQAVLEARTDHDQIAKWREEIEQLNAKIRQAKVIVELGSPAASAATNDAPINTVCPVSAKAVDAGKTLVHAGRKIAFCCDDCKARFQQDPAAYLAKLPPLMPQEPVSETKQ